MKRISFCLFVLTFFSVISFAADKQDNSLFLLKSSSLKEQAKIADRYTCDGADVSPDLSWEGAPTQTKSLALVFADLDAPQGTFYHWVIYNMPPKVTSLPQAISTFPAPTIVAPNSWGRTRYNGPCPPAGATHYYVFTLYALDEMLDPTKKFNINNLLNEFQKHLLDKIELGVSYGR